MEGAEHSKRGRVKQIFLIMIFTSFERKGNFTNLGQYHLDPSHPHDPYHLHCVDHWSPWYFPSSSWWLNDQVWPGGGKSWSSSGWSAPDRIGRHTENIFQFLSSSSSSSSLSLSSTSTWMSAQSTCVKNMSPHHYCCQLVAAFWKWPWNILKMENTWKCWNLEKSNL